MTDGAARSTEIRAEDVADRLHSAAIHLLRRVRRRDTDGGVTAPHLSVLSVLVFAGPKTLGELAAAEGVTPPSMTRLVRNLEARGLAEREADAADRRVSRIRATDAGQRALADTRARRLSDLASRLGALTGEELALLARAAELIERVAR
jgi:DNA-binding MarR family transcriptional regulator